MPGLHREVGITGLGGIRESASEADIFNLCLERICPWRSGERTFQGPPTSTAILPFLLRIEPRVRPEDTEASPATRSGHVTKNLDNKT